MSRLVDNCTVNGTYAVFSVQLYEKEGHYLGAEHSQHGTVVKVTFVLRVSFASKTFLNEQLTNTCRGLRAFCHQKMC